MIRKQTIVGLIGAGRIGKMHGENILFHLPEAFLKAVTDPELDTSWAEQAGIPVYSQNNSAILSDPEIEAVVIAASTTSHVELIIESAQAGKQIFCEKPIGFDPEAVARAIQAANDAGVTLQVGFNRRFDPDFARIHDTVQAGKIGTPHIVRITNRDPTRPDTAFIPHSGGLFIDFSIHDFDTARFLINSEVEEVFARGAVLIDLEIEKLGDIDTALITLKMSNGAFCVIDNSRETGYGYDQQLEVFGSKGRTSARNKTPTSTELCTVDGVQTDNPHPSFVERYREAYILELQQFFRCIREKTAPRVTGEDALMAIKIAQAAKRSYKQNKPVRLER